MRNICGFALTAFFVASYEFAMAQGVPANADDSKGSPPVPESLLSAAHRAAARAGIENGTDVIDAVSLGWHYVHATNCEGHQGKFFVFPKEGGYWFTTSTAAELVLAPECATGNLIGFHVVSTSGFWDAIYTYDHQ
jgi:hypothetical protein